MSSTLYVLRWRITRLTQTLQSALHSVQLSSDRFQRLEMGNYRLVPTRSAASSICSGVGRRAKVREYVWGLIPSLLTNEMSCNLWDQLHNDPVTVRRCFIRAETPTVSKNIYMYFFLLFHKNEHDLNKQSKRTHCI